MQGNHVMFRQILHTYIGKLRIKNQSSNALIRQHSFSKYQTNSLGSVFAELMKEMQVLKIYCRKINT